MRVLLPLVCVLVFPFAAVGDELPVGTTQFTLSVGSGKLDVFTYRPSGFDPKTGRMLLVFHGVNRNAEEYRDWAKPLSDATGAVVAAPKFTKQAFPTAAYQQGNVLTDRKVNSKADWTWHLVPKVADELRRRVGRADAPFDLIGHSAGGQFLARAAGFLDTGAERIVAANPGTHLFPTRDMAYPLGFGGLPDELSNDAALRRYLAQPLTFYLGTADTEADSNFDKSPAAMQQGANRYERGMNAFRMGKKLADDRGWVFNWKLVEADKVGHVAEKMFAHPNARLALTGKAK